MMCVGELVENCCGGDFMIGLQGGDVFLQGLWIVGDVQDVFEIGGYGEGVGIEFSLWWIDEEC